MKTTPVTPADLGASVFAVPPVARNQDLSLNRAANQAQIRHIEAGGVTTLLYGGNANFFHLRVSEYPAMLDMLEELAAPGTWVIPSVGPEYGLLMDQVAILKQRRFPTAMVLPLASPGNSDGLETGIAQAAEVYGRKLILYIKSETGLTPEALGRLVKRGMVCAVKYGIERPEPAKDDFLKRILDNVDRSLVVSGMGERPAIIHMRDFGLAGFTSGCVCIAPRGSRLMLKAALRKDWARGRAAARDLHAARGMPHPPAPDPRAARGADPVRHRRHGPDPADAEQHRRQTPRRDPRARPGPQEGRRKRGGEIAPGLVNRGAP